MVFLTLSLKATFKVMWRWHEFTIFKWRHWTPNQSKLLGHLTLVIINFCFHTCSRHPVVHSCRWSIGMVASSSTPPPSAWEGSLEICSSVACCTTWYGSTSLQQLHKGSCSLHVSSHNLRADCQRRTLVPPLISSANAAILVLCPTSVH